MELNKIYQMDCIEGMKKLPDKSIDMILTDLPYGTTACKWDNIIPFEPLWEQYERVIKDNGAIALFGVEPFSSTLRMSKLSMYKYDWIWKKNQPTGFANVKRQPMRNHELISVFYKKQPTYNPIKEPRELNDKSKQRYNYKFTDKDRVNNIQGINKKGTSERYNKDLRFPTTIKDFKGVVSHKRLHPTQKPVELVEYLIKTYTNENETVLDSCMGSGTTAVAAMRTKRNYIGFEIESEYLQIAQKRIEDTKELMEQGDLFTLERGGF